MLRFIKKPPNKFIKEILKIKKIYKIFDKVGE